MNLDPTSDPMGRCGANQEEKRRMRYRKRPVVIEAVQYDGTFPLAFLRGDERVTSGSAGSLEISTLEGVMRAEKGDWIIRGIKGELYPCKPDIFAQTYEAVSDAQ